MLGRTSIEISHGKIVIIWVIFIKTTVFKQSAVVFQVYYKSPHHPSLYAIKPFLIILKTATWLNSDSSIITKPHVITMRTISLMLSPAYKIPKFVLDSFKADKARDSKPQNVISVLDLHLYTNSHVCRPFT